ncbi:SDR family oxidoreductase [Pandoraea nosoerga]|uniref:Short-chain dehydrogenase n=1 Tax=Pandoraea nosoerga TaxID=2508296 RepID=A0A5E4RI96_9BURK|nr:SDR family oxidoreductase [Pandoraea nosoerga]MBN4664460.1 SDR family oxidoreductase [Pandoraea nosoerga]MBN4674504.1 SDR family oxidoreductase [Pandoraea nosoerga]MBN4679772.1 SDR family oxidoreductase [Pandoraea nosoerga]MBN4743140.1 SDR family oxidoreductase [Pandoraea nosoerga]VVD62845.1 short-chain dehydrogenase [Pandoraea nosoerga]
MNLLPESRDPIRLDGKVALVTGASRGIGRAIAIALAARGATVAVHYNAAQDDAETLVAALHANGSRAFAVRADLASPDGALALIERFTGALAAHHLPPRFDILVNNAGVGLRARIDAVTPEAFDRVLQVNLKSPFFLIQHALAYLRDGGRIVNVSSMGTRAAYPEMSVYAPAKAGLEALTRLLAADLGARAITVNAVLPGATATDLNRRASDPVEREVIAKTVALGRVGEPRDIADIVAFLASDAARWITGQSLDASGGQRL